MVPIFDVSASFWFYSFLLYCSRVPVFLNKMLSLVDANLRAKTVNKNGKNGNESPPELPLYSVELEKFPVKLLKEKS